MIMQVYAVADSGVDAYMPPFYARARGEAIRGFTDLVNNRETTVNRYPNQYELVYLGTWDDATGVFTTLPPESVMTALDVYEPFTPDKKSLTDLMLKKSG